MHPSAPDLIRALQDARSRTLALVGDLKESQFDVPQLEHVNPFLWELGHVAFFYDVFVLGSLDHSEPLIERARERFESFTVAHARRWKLDFPDRDGILAYMARVEARVLERLRAEPLSAETRYLHQLAVRHEDMHGEAFTYMRQALDYRAPSSYSRSPSLEVDLNAGPHPGDVQVAAGSLLLGSSPGDEFTFDNERPAHWVDVAAFSMGKAPVTNAEYLEFVRAGGYAKAEFWSAAGLAWKRKAEVVQPVYWHNKGDEWRVKCFGALQELSPHQPMVHLSYWEAQAFCSWAERRLPSEAEWEWAARGAQTDDEGLYPWGSAPPTPERAQLDARHIGCADVAAFPAGDSPWGCRQMLGNVWEWTCSDFYPYPGFKIDAPYREYSAPWFGDHKVLRGGAWATRSRLIRCNYRNFFRPDRRDIFSGLRTCAR